MYNKELKTKFIERQIRLSEGKKLDGFLAYYTNTFNRLAPFEAEIDKDICNMTDEEVNTVLKKYLRGGKTYQNSTLSVLGAYTGWAIDNKYSSNIENFFAEKNARRIDTSGTYENLMVRDENELAGILDEVNVFESEAVGSVDNLYRCYLHLLFAGIMPAEALEIKKKDFDRDNKIIHIIRGDISISPRLCKLLVNFMELESFHRHVNNMGSRYDPINKSKYLLETTSKNRDISDPNYRQKIKPTWDAAISKKMKNASKNLKQMNILLSGVFSRMYEKEKEMHKIDLTEYFSLKSGTAMAIESPQRLMLIGKNEYETWKKAFKLD